MNAVALFPALSQALFVSLAQALFVYILVRVALVIFKDLNSTWRYNLLYSSLVLICAGFIISFFRYYYPLAQISHESASQHLTDQSSGAGLFSWKMTTPYSFWIVRIYLSGVGLQTLFLLMGFYRLRYQHLENNIPACDFWYKRLDDLKRRFGMSKNIALYLSDKILVPFTLGFIKPVILLPVAMINQLTPEQTESILLHELAHIKRHDYLMNIFQRLMEIVLFFNPVIWLLSSEIRKEREFCCDDLVLQNVDNPGNYARALTLIEENRISINNLTMALNGNKKFNLFHRIQRLSNMKTFQTNPKQPLLAVLTILAISLSLAWMVPADSTKAKKPIKESRLNKLKDNAMVNPPPAPSAPILPDTLASVPPVPPAVPEVEELPKPPLPPFRIDTNEFKNFSNSPEWKKQMREMKIETEKMKKQFNSPEWKKQMQEMKIEAEKIKKQFDSPEWKMQMEEMKIEAEKMKKQFDSPEWKKQMENMKIETEKIKKQFDSPEWKKQMQEKLSDTEGN